MKYRMSVAIVPAFVFAIALAPAGAKNFSSTGALAAYQQGPGRGPITAPRDPELEKQSKHNLEVAKYYFYKRKPDKNDKGGMDRLNKAVEGRLQEILDLNPQFARRDDVYFMLGEVNKRMGNDEKAVEYWTKAVSETSDEKIKTEAQKRLDESKSADKSENKDQKKG